MIIFGIIVIALIIFLVMRNQKDKKKLEEKLNSDFHKSKDEEGDAEIDHVLKWFIFGLLGDIQINLAFPGLKMDMLNSLYPCPSSLQGQQHFYPRIFPGK